MKGTGNPTQKGVLHKEPRNVKHYYSVITTVNHGFLTFFSTSEHYPGPGPMVGPVPDGYSRGGKVIPGLGGSENPL